MKPGQITSGVVLREGMRALKFISEHDANWIVDLNTAEEDEITLCLHPKSRHAERWHARIFFCLPWHTPKGETHFPHVWHLQRRYLPGEAPKNIRDWPFRKGGAKTTQEAAEAIFSSIAEMEGTDRAASTTHAIDTDATLPPPDPTT